MLLNACFQKHDFKTISPVLMGGCKLPKNMGYKKIRDNGLSVEKICSSFGKFLKKNISKSTLKF